MNSPLGGALTTPDLNNGMTLKTVNGAELKIKKVGRTIWVNDAKVQTADVISSNGVTFVINKVRMPK